MKTCYNCGAPISKETCEGFPEVCEHWIHKKPLTNYDLLIRKTPEEMAEWMAKNQDCYACVYSDDEGRCIKARKGRHCQEILLDWLKSPAEEGEK